MKSHIAIFASLFLASTPFVSPAIASETRIIAQEINLYIKDNIAREISVKITSEENGGSGVIIAQQDNTYLILTNAHVLRDDETFDIQTHDGIIHQAKPVTNGIETDDDLALLEFSSDNSYQIADINIAATPRVDQSIIAVGYDAATGKLVVEEGKIQRVSDRSFKDGYQIGYSNNIVQGMSGGAILNADGEVIGINGKSAFPIVNTGYVYHDGTKPTSEEIEQLRQLSWGLTINRLLTQVNPEIITAYGLPQPETTAKVENTQLTGWLGDLEQKAKNITVRIDSNSGANGSGVIIAKENNTYTVLTAAHVICEKNQGTKKCIDYIYELVAPDGKKYTLDKSTFKRQEGVDLAVVQLTSKEEYEIATLANYYAQNENYVFAAGFPRLNPKVPAKWRFSPGLVYENEISKLLVNLDSDFDPDKANILANPDSFAGGYELVYTSITHGGMSGGAVLDAEGRVIGIHGLAEGESIDDKQSSSTLSIQSGYSLGIPINTFLGLVNQFDLNQQQLQIEDSQPSKLGKWQQDTITNSIVNVGISKGNTTAKQWLERGNQLWRIFRFEEAVQAFDKAIELNPSSHLAWYGKGIAFKSQKKHEAAVIAFEEATNLKPDFYQAFQRQSESLRTLNKPQDALVAINEAINLDKSDSNLYSYRGLILGDLKRYSQAVSSYTKAIALNPRASYYSDRGLEYYKDKKLDLALADYNQAIKINSEFVIALNNRGRLYSDLEQWDSAKADFNYVIKIDPNYASAYYNRGDVYKSTNKLNLALADFNQAIKINPNIDLFYFDRGLTYQKRNELDLALADFDKSIEINPDFWFSHIMRGVINYSSKNLELALADFNKVIEIQPKFTPIYGIRGVIYFSQDKTNLALADFNKYLNSQDEYINSTFANNSNLGAANQFFEQLPRIILGARALVYASEKKWDLALNDINQSLKLNSNSWEVLLERANIYFLTEKWNLALADYERVLVLSKSEHIPAINKIGLIKYEQGEIAEARRKFEKTIELKPESTATKLALSVTLSNLGEPEKAKLLAEEALRENAGLANIKYLEQSNWGEKLVADTEKFLLSNNTVVLRSSSSDKEARGFRELINRGDLYSKQKKWDLALADYNKAIELNPDKAVGYKKRGFYYQQQEKWDLALADYNKATKLDPNNSGIYVNIGFVYDRQQRFELALDNYNKAIKINPKNIVAYHNRGCVYHKQNNYSAALADYNKVLSLDSNYLNTINHIGLIKYEQGEIEAAQDEFEKVLAINAFEGEPQLAIAVILSKLKQSEKAVDTAQIALSSTKKLSDYRHLQQNLWGDKLIADTKKLIGENPKIIRNSQQFYAFAEQGQAFSRKQNWDKAIENYSKALEIHPNNFLVYHYRGDIYNKQKQWNLALADYSKAITINPKFANAYAQTAGIYFEQKKWDLVFDNVKKAISLNPNYSSGYLYRGIYYQVKKKWDLALANFNKAISIKPDNAYFYLSRANFYSIKEEFDKALIDYNKAISLDSKLVTAYKNRGEIHYKQGDLNLALSDYNQAILHNSKDADAYYKRGNLFYDRQEWDSALADYQQAIKLNPQYGNAYSGRAKTYYQKKKWNLALADYNKVSEIDPKYAVAYNDRGNIYTEQGKLDLAFAEYKKAIELNPQYALAYYNRGDTYQLQEKYDLAIADYNKAIEIDPQYASAYSKRGEIYRILEKWDLAIADFQKVRSLNKQDTFALWNLGFIQYEIGELEIARQYFEQVINLHGETAENFLALAVTLYNLEEEEKALLMAEAAIRTDKKYLDVEFLREKNWGNRLIVDTEKLLTHPKIQTLLSQE